MVGVIAACLVAIPTGLAATPVWTAPSNVTEGNDTSVHARVAVEGSGASTIAFEVAAADGWYVGAASGQAGVFNRVRLDGPLKQASYPRVASTVGGIVTVAYVVPTGIRYATRQPDGTWSDPATIAATAAGDLSLAGGPGGDDVTFLWTEKRDGTTVVRSALRHGTSSAEASADLGSARFIGSARLDRSADGAMRAIWCAVENGVSSILEARLDRRRSGVPVIERPGLIVSCDAATAPDGATAFVWSEVSGPTVSVRGALRRQSGEWRPTVEFASSDRGAPTPRVVAGLDSVATAVYSIVRGGRGVVQGVVRRPGENWAAPVDLSEPGLDASEAGIVVAPDSTVTAIWRATRGTESLAQTASRTPGSQGWSSVTTLSAPLLRAFSPTRWSGSTACRSPSGRSRTAAATSRPPLASCRRRPDVGLPRGRCAWWEDRSSAARSAVARRHRHPARW